MSLVGDAIARATAAGTTAALIAQLVNVRLEQRDGIRSWLSASGSPGAPALLAELEARWRGLDAGKFGGILW